MAFIRILDLKNFREGENKIRANRIAGQYMGYTIDWTSLVTGTMGLMAFASVYFLGMTLDALWQKALLGATVQAWIVLFCFNVSHDVSHDLVFKRNPKYRLINNIFGYMMSTPSLACLHGFKETHLEHHRKTNVPVDDPNHWVVRGSLPALIAKLSISPFLDAYWMLRFAREKPMPYIARALYTFWACSAVLAAFMIWQTGFWNTLFMWLMPAYINFILVFVFVAIIPHRQSPDAPGEQIEKIVIFPAALQGVSNFLHAGHNFHLLHHMYPRVPSHKYGPIARRLMAIQEADARRARTGAENPFRERAEASDAAEGIETGRASDRSRRTTAAAG